MKLSIITFLLISFFYANAQVIDTVSTGTTEIEYNYLTKAYKTDMEEGRDIKNGYSIALLHKQTIKPYEFQFYSFIRNDKKQTACILAIVKNNSLIKSSNYFCIPINNTDLEKKYFEEL